MTAVYLTARHEQTPAQAWADSEGLYVCADHWHEARRWLDTDHRLIACPDALVTEVLGQGQCDECREEWATGVRLAYEADARLGLLPFTRV